MDAFKLAPREDDERTQFAQDNLLDPKALPPPAFANFSQQFKQLLAPSARAGRTVMLAGAPFAQAVDAVGEVADDASDILGTMRNPGWHPSEDTERTTAQDWYFKNVVDDIGTSAVTAWTPDAASTGSASRAVGTVFQVLGSVPQMVAAPELFLADSALSPAVDIINAGGDAETAAKVGGIQLAANAVGFRLPAAFGTNLLTRVGTGAGVNLATGVPADVASQAVLENAGLTEQAKSYDPFSPEARTLDVLMGAAFGWRAHLTAPPVTPSQRAAILTANNAHHSEFEAMPGEPKDGTAAAQHRTAMNTAIEQVLRDQHVNVAIDAAGFELRPELVQGERNYAAADAAENYGSVLVALESGGDANAKAGTSTATGLHQFTEGTWLKTVEKVRPDLTRSMSREELLALRTDPDVSAQMERELRATNAAALENAGQPVTTWNLYAAHHFGEGKGVEFARASDDTPVSEILTQAQIKANPYLADMTKGQVIADWQRKARRAGVYTEAEMDAPNFGLPEAPRPLPDESPLLAETNKIDTPERDALRKQIVEDSFAGIEPPKLEEGQRPVAYVMGGGGGAGKGTILKDLIAKGEAPREGVVHIDPDEIKGRIPEYQQLRQAKDSRAAAVVHEESSQLARDVLKKAVAGKYDVVLDRTLGDKAKGLAELQALKDAGYDIRLAGVTVDPRAAVERAVKRAQGSGRFVPLDQLLKAHKGFADAFEDYAKLADRVQLFDNTGAAPVLLASGKGGSLDIVESEGYNRFRQRSQINDQAKTYRALQAAPGRADVGQPSGQARPGGDNQAERGRGDRGGSAQRLADRGSAQDPEALARQGDAAIVDEIAAQFPDMLIPDADGNLRPLADFLAAAREAQALDDLTLRGIDAATNCAIGIEA